MFTIDLWYYQKLYFFNALVSQKEQSCLISTVFDRFWQLSLIIIFHDNSDALKTIKTI